MSILNLVRRSVLAAPLALSLLAAVPAHAQGQGPLEACLDAADGQAEAFEACLLDHASELEAEYGLPAGWRARLHDYLQSHPIDWDQLEDLADVLENRWDRAENVRDRHENRIDVWEDRHDDQVDLEDVFDRREDRRDRAEDRWDRREGVRDRIENRRDRQH